MSVKRQIHEIEFDHDGLNGPRPLKRIRIDDSVDGTEISDEISILRSEVEALNEEINFIQHKNNTVIQELTRQVSHERKRDDNQKQKRSELKEIILSLRTKLDNLECQSKVDAFREARSQKHTANILNLTTASLIQSKREKEEAEMALTFYTNWRLRDAEEYIPITSRELDHTDRPCPFSERLVSQEKTWQKALKLFQSLTSASMEIVKKSMEERVSRLAEAYFDDMGCCLCGNDDWIKTIESGQEVSRLHESKGVLVPSQCGHRICISCLQAWRETAVEGIIHEARDIASEEPIFSDEESSPVPYEGPILRNSICCPICRDRWDVSD